MNLKRHIHIVWILLIYIDHTQSLGNFISERMLKHAPTTTGFIINTINNANDVIIDNQLLTQSNNNDKEDIEITRTTMTPQPTPSNNISNFCGSNKMNDDTSTNDYYQYNWHNTNNENATSTPSPTQTVKIPQYSVDILDESTSPIISFINDTSTYQQVFNPSWIPTSDKVTVPGVMAQVQNCTFKVSLLHTA